MYNSLDASWMSFSSAVQSFSGSLESLPSNTKGTAVQNQTAQQAAWHVIEMSRSFTAIRLVSDEDLEQFIGQVERATSIYLRILQGGGFTRRFLGSSTERKADAALSALRLMVTRMRADLQERPARYRLMKQEAMRRARESVFQESELFELRPLFVKDRAFAFCLASALARKSPALIRDHIGSFSLTGDEQAEILSLAQNPSQRPSEGRDFSYGYALALIAQESSRPNTATHRSAEAIQNSYRPGEGISLPTISPFIVFRNQGLFQGILGKAASHLGFPSIDALWQAWKRREVTDLPETLKEIVRSIIREWMEHSDRGDIPVNCRSRIREVNGLLTRHRVGFDTVCTLPLVTDRTFEFSNLRRKLPVCEGAPLREIFPRLQASTEKQFVLELHKHHRVLGHSIHVSLDRLSFCDTNDVNGLTGLPRVREGFTTKEEMLQYLQNYVDLMYSDRYDRFTLTPYERISTAPAAAPSAPAPVLPTLPLHLQRRESSNSESGLLKAAVYVGIALLAKYFLW